MAFALLSKIKEFFVPVPLQSTLTKKEVEHIQYRLQWQLSKVIPWVEISISCGWGVHHFVKFQELHTAHPNWLTARVLTLRDKVTKDMYGDTIIRYENTATQLLLSIQQATQKLNSPITKLNIIDQCDTNSVYDLQISTANRVNSTLLVPDESSVYSPDLWDYTIICMWGGSGEWNYRVVHSTAKPIPTEMNL